MADIAALPAARLSSIGSFRLLLVHRQHALGDQEAAEDVDRGEHQRDEAEALRPASDRPPRRPRRRRPPAARRPRSPRRWRWSPTSAACAAPASPTRRRNSRRRSPARRSTGGRRRDRWPAGRGMGRGRRRVGDRIGLVHGLSPLPPKAGWTTAPSRVRLVALTSSSSQLTASAFFALSISVSTKA